MSKGNKKGGLKTAQVNNENNAASSQNAIVAAMASTTMGNSSMDRNHQVDLLKMIHDRCFLDQNATEHTGLSEEAIDKINHVNFLGMVTVYANEINSGNSDFAMVLRKAALPELMEACAEVGITLDETKLIESKKDDGTEIISVPSTAANIPEETKKNLDADKAAVEATKGKTYDPTKIKDENELKEALSGLLAINREEKFIESIYKAIGFWLSYQKIVANRELNTAKETLSKTKDKEYKAKAQEAVNTAQDRIKNLNSMSNTDVFREIVKITGRVGTLCYGIANHIILQTASTGSPISGFCCLHSASLNKETGICKYSDNELADIVKCLVEYEANNIRTKALKTIEEENALPEKDRVQSHIDTANKNIKFADKAMEAITNAPADFVANLKEKYLAKDNFAHKTVIAIKKAYYRGVTNDEWNRVKIDSLLDNCTQYAGVISNLFRDPNNQLAGYSLASADHLDFKTPEEVSAEKLEAEKAAAKAAEEKKKEDEEKKAAAIKKKEDEAKQKEKAAKKAAKAAAKAEAKEKTKKLFDQLRQKCPHLLIVLSNYLTFSGLVKTLNNYQSMKNLVTSLLGIAFVVLGCNIANIMGYSPPTNLQTVAASTVLQPMDHFYGQVKNAKPDTVYQDKIVHDTVPCNHKSQPQKSETVIKRTVIKKTDTSYVPLLWIAEPGEKADSTNHNYTIRKGELCDYKQIISKVCK